MNPAALTPAVPAQPPGSVAPLTQRLDKAAHQFEAMLLQELLKPLSASSDDGEADAKEASLGGSSASGPLEGFGIQALAERLANSGALGFAKQIEHSLQHRVASSPGQRSTDIVAKENPSEKPVVSANVFSGPADKP